MKIQVNQRTVSSFLSYLDNKIQTQGEAFFNVTGQFYPTPSPYYGLSCYSSPYKQLCSDTLVTGATVLTGVYLNGNPITIGQSGLNKVNYQNGALFFTGTLPASSVITGSYSVKECNIELTNLPEYKILFETKYVSNPKFAQTFSGLPLDTKTVPSIFVKVKASENKPFAFQRIDDNQINLRLVVVAENEFQLLGISNILQNLNMTEFRIVSGANSLDHLGNYTGGSPYNYTGQTFASGLWPLITESRLISIPLRGEYANMSRNVGMCDLTISTVMVHP